MPIGSSARRPLPKEVEEEGGSALPVSDTNNTALTKPGGQVIRLCKELGVLLCLLCPAAIKPGINQVKNHYRNRHRTALQDPTDKDIELPINRSPPITELETHQVLAKHNKEEHKEEDKKDKEGKSSKQQRN
ncbi:hypothetical protein FOXYSP1_18830 [Fusarium oxysporum f. sp. phaseoli]